MQQIVNGKEVKEGDTFYTECKQGRAVYDLHWSQVKPWCLYWQGTQTICVPDLYEAAKYFAKKRTFLRTKV